MNFEIRKDGPALGVVLAAVIGALIPFLAGSIADIEEMTATAMPMTLAFRALADGSSPFWTPLLGLGLPQPFRISYLLHPLGASFAFGAVTGTNVLTSAHLAIGATATYFLATYLGLTRFAATVCAITVTFSTTIAQSIYVDDWFTHVVTWSTFPLSILLLMRLLDSTDTRSAAFFALALGLTIGFQCATGLIIRAMSQLLLLAPIALARPGPTFQKLGWLAAGAAVAIIVSAANWLVLFEEYSYATAAGSRALHRNFTLVDHLWGTFVLPFANLAGIAHPPGALTWRVIGFGPVLAVLALFQLFRPPASDNVRALYFGLAASIVLILLPPAASFDFFTATWTFRDGVNLYGILLGGLLLSSLRPRTAQTLGALQCALVIVAVWPLLKVNTMRAFQEEFSGRTTARDAATESDFVSAIQSAASGRHARFLMAPHFSRQRNFAEDGIADNLLAYFGIPIVNGIARGVATDSLHPDLGLLEGGIQFGPSALFNRDLLNVLGVTHIIALASDKHEPNLVLDRVIKRRRGPAVYLLRNPHAWPPAVLTDESASTVRLPRLPHCEHDRFLCADFGTVVGHRLDGPPIDVTQRYGRIVIKMRPADTERTLMLSIWYRPGWHADRAGISIFPVFEQLTGIRVPAGIGNVTLTFVPPVRFWSHVAGAFVFFTGGIALILLGVARARREGDIDA